jgi:hypothetical protein
MPVVEAFVAVMDPSASDGDQSEVLQTIDSTGGEVVMLIGDTAAVVSGGQSVSDALAQLVGLGLSAVATAADELPAGLDPDLTELIVAWLASQDPAVVAAKDDPARDGQAWDPLGGCGQGLAL